MDINETLKIFNSYDVASDPIVLGILDKIKTAAKCGEGSCYAELCYDNTRNSSIEVYFLKLGFVVRSWKPYPSLNDLKVCRLYWNVKKQQERKRRLFGLFARKVEEPSEKPKEDQLDILMKQIAEMESSFLEHKAKNSNK